MGAMTKDQQRQRAWAGEQAAMVAILLLGFALRVYRLGAESLWLDELGQASVASLGLRSAVQGAQLHHGAAPLDYIFTWLALLVAHDDFVVRLPAAFFGTLTLALVYRLGQELFDGPVGVLAALLLAIAPLHLRYSQEARFYALFTCLAVASTWVLLLALRRNDRRGWAVYTVLLIASFYSHYYTLLLILFHGLAVLLAPRLQDRQAAAPDPIPPIYRFVLSYNLAMIAFLPWILYAVLGETGTPLSSPPVLTGAFLARVLAALAIGHEAGQPPWPPLLLYGGLAAVGALAGLADRRTRLGAFLLALLLLASVPLIVLGLRLTDYFFAFRQVLFLLPFFLLLVAAGVMFLARGLAARASGRWRLAWQAVVAVLLLAVLIWPLPAGIRAAYTTQRQDWRDALAFVDANAGPGDAIATPRVHPSYFAYYAPTWSQRVVTPTSPEEVLALGEDSPAVWTLIIPEAYGVGHDVERRLAAEGALRIGFGDDMTVYYWQPGHSLQQVLQETLAWQPPHSPDALASLARAYAAAGMPDAAIVAAGQAVDLAGSPQGASGYEVLQGVIYRDAGQEAEAVASFRRALELWPDNVEALVNLGQRLLLSGRPEAAGEAEPLLARAVNLAPGDYWAQRLLGDALWQQGQQARAVKAFQAAAAADPEEPTIQFRLGAALAASGDPAGAAAAYERYLALAPGGPRAAEARERLAELQANDAAPPSP